MGVFDGRDLDIRVLVNRAGAGIVTEEYFDRGNRPHPLADPDVRTHGEELHQRLDARVRPGRPVNVDRPGSVEIIFAGEQPAETAGVVTVRMGDEDIVDVADSDAGTSQATGNAFAGIHDIQCAVDDQNVRRLRPPHHRARTASGPQRDETGARLERRCPAAVLRSASARERYNTDADHCRE